MFSVKNFNSGGAQKMDKLYKNILKYRLARKMTQEELAECLGYSTNTMIARVEKGEVDLPYSKIKKLSEIFDVSIPVLMGHIDSKYDDMVKKLSNLNWEELNYIKTQVEFALFKYKGIVPEKAESRDLGE